MSSVVVRRYARSTGERYSIRRRADGSFQVYRDNPYEGLNVSYQFEDQPISGLFADIQTAEAELLPDPEMRIEDSS
jgi:hypothetical protein